MICFDKKRFADFVTEEDAKIRIANISNDIVESDLFEQPKVIQLRWDKTYMFEEYYGFVQTGNSFLSLSSQQREAAKHELEAYFE